MRTSESPPPDCRDAVDRKVFDSSCEHQTKHHSQITATEQQLQHFSSGNMDRLTVMWIFVALIGISVEDDITAFSAEVFSSEDSIATVSCGYSGRAENLQWYRQDPGSAPQFLLLITNTKEPTVVRAKPENPRLTAELNQERNQVDLKISSAAVSDSAVYYCALRPTVAGNSKTVNKNLWSKDKTILHNIH